MKTKHLIVSILVLVLTIGLAHTGFAGMDMMKIADSCTNKDTNARLQSGDYQKKVENFIVLQDASSTMGEKAYVLIRFASDKGDDAFNYDYKLAHSKLAHSKDLVRCMNTTLPDNFDVDGGLRAFGPFDGDKGLLYGMTDYSKAGLDSGVSAVGGSGGMTPIANALIYGAYDLLDTPGLKDTPAKTAMILFSDGLNTAAADPVKAAADIKAMYGNNICIYTVLLGSNPMGRATMEQIADASKCGFATDSDAIGNAQGMDKFVTDVFLTKVERKPAPVMERPAEKISMTLHFEFDFDKSVVRSEHHDDAKKVADALNKYSQATAELEGHTDSMGTDDYNMSLSKRRADSVKMYIVEKFNIKASRISTVGYGESKPVASNKTDEGRQRNRRVVAHIQ